MEREFKSIHRRSPWLHFDTNLWFKQNVGTITASPSRAMAESINGGRSTESRLLTRRVATLEWQFNCLVWIWTSSQSHISNTTRATLTPRMDKTTLRISPTLVLLCLTYNQLPSSLEVHCFKPKWLTSQQVTHSVLLAQVPFYNLTFLDRNRLTWGLPLDQGELYGWGFNDKGQLGIGHRINREAPQKITALKGKRVVDIACGQQHSLAVTGNLQFEQKNIMWMCWWSLNR